MHSTVKVGRDREIDEIVSYERAVEVARLLLGELDGPMRPIFPEDYEKLPRRQLKSGKYSVRDDRRRELERFCRKNFQNLRFEKLARLYEPLYERGSSWQVPLTDFANLLGEPGDGVLSGAPLHATVSISPWGLQTEYPEMHLIKDLAVAFNDLLSVDSEIKKYEGTSWKIAKTPTTRRKIGEFLRRAAFNRRMCLLSCFNLIEAYINGLSWAYVQTHDISKLSQKQQNLLVQGHASILDKLVKVPQIVAGQSPGPLSQEREPLKLFKETIKPFRDSIVHASPFSAPERFGGYEKLSKVYQLTTETVRMAIGVSLEIISTIHRFVGGAEPMPPWVPPRKGDGAFEVESAV